MKQTGAFIFALPFLIVLTVVAVKYFQGLIPVSPLNGEANLIVLAALCILFAIAPLSGAYLMYTDRQLGSAIVGIYSLGALAYCLAYLIDPFFLSSDFTDDQAAALRVRIVSAAFLLLFGFTLCCSSAKSKQ